MDIEITPEPSADERRAILEALDGARARPAAYSSIWRASALADLRDGALAKESGGDAGFGAAAPPGHHAPATHPPPPARAAPRPGAGYPPHGRRDGLRPRFELAEIARRDDDAALERREAEAGDEELARDDRDDHPAGKDALVDQHDEHRQDEQLVRDRVEQRAER